MANSERNRARGTSHISRTRAGAPLGSRSVSTWANGLGCPSFFVRERPRIDLGVCSVRALFADTAAVPSACLVGLFDGHGFAGLFEGDAFAGLFDGVDPALELGRPVARTTRLLISTGFLGRVWARDFVPGGSGRRATSGDISDSSPIRQPVGRRGLGTSRTRFKRVQTDNF
jgi:hypothetical protein